VDPTEPISRRRILLSHGSGGALAVLAGCTDENTEIGNGSSNGTGDRDGSEDRNGNSDDSDSDSGSESEATDNETQSGSDDTDDSTGSETEESDDSLDLREANVVDVSFEGQDGSYTFDVSLRHDDDGEEGYANWWQLERPDGTQLGRRDLTHPHSQQPFTRSETIEIPDDVDCVVVRGHDQTHGYGGLAVAVDLGSGTMRTIDQGTEKQPFEAEMCPG
jgi:hypothetical protein